MKYSANIIITGVQNGTIADVVINWNINNN